MHKRKKRRNIGECAWAGIAFGTAFGTAVCTLTEMLSAFVVCTFIRSVKFLPFFTLLSLTAGGWSAGRLCGHISRRHGLINGFLCGTIMYLLLCIAGIVLHKGAAEAFKLAVLCLSSAVGSVAEVNRKSRKYMK